MSSETFGEIVVQSIYDGGEMLGVKIMEAPEHALFSADFLGMTTPYMDVADGVVTLRGHNFTALYRVGVYRPYERCYEANLLAAFSVPVCPRDPEEHRP